MFTKQTAVTNTVIIGAGPAGLAVAGCLQKKGIPFILIEKNGAVGSSWRKHYDRLKLHTTKRFSTLPYRTFDDKVGRYPTRDELVKYMDVYVRKFDLQPIFKTKVSFVKKVGDLWQTETNYLSYFTKNVIIATGLVNEPIVPVIDGIESFPGNVIHSSQYKNGEAYTGKNVLVVGFGNSACEQAICLHEHGAHPSMSVRSPVNILPRDIFGIPVLQIGIFFSLLPAKLADIINAPIRRLIVGNIKKLGLKKSKMGPMEQIQRQRKIPLLDIGTTKLIRKGKIKIFDEIDRIDGPTVYFKGGKKQDFDAIIFGTGYRHSIESLLEVGPERLADLQKKVSKQKHFGEDGLYFPGFHVSPTGMLREISKEAKKIASDIVRKYPNAIQQHIYRG